MDRARLKKGGHMAKWIVNAANTLSNGIEGLWLSVMDPFIVVVGFVLLATLLTGVGFIFVRIFLGIS